MDIIKKVIKEFLTRTIGKFLKNDISIQQIDTTTDTISIKDLQFCPIVNI